MNDSKYTKINSSRYRMTTNAEIFPSHLTTLSRPPPAVLSNYHGSITASAVAVAATTTAAVTRLQQQLPQAVLSNYHGTITASAVAAAAAAATTTAVTTLQQQPPPLTTTTTHPNLTMDDHLMQQTELPGGHITHSPHHLLRFIPYALRRPHLQSVVPSLYLHAPPRIPTTTRPKTPISPPPQPEGTHIGHLYPEILEMIFEKLSVRDRGRAAQVCTAWRDAAYAKSVWKGVEAKLHLKRPTPSLFTSLVKRGIKKIQILSLRRSLKDVVIGVPNMISLNLSGCYNVSDVNLGHAFSTDLPNLKILDLSLCKQITDSSLGRIAQHLKNLEILELGGCCNITNTGLLLIAWGLKKLKHLNLRSCWHISDQGIGHLSGLSKETAEGNLELEYLGLQDCQRLSDEALGHIAQGLKSLKSINLSFCVSITDSGLKHLARMQQLKELNLRSCDNISDIGMAYLTDGGSNITSLDVSFCDKISDQALNHISQGLYHLRTLSLNQCQITDDGMIKIAKSLHELEILNIGQCNRITDKGLQALAEDLTNLKTIDLYGCTQLSPQGLHIIMKLPKLVKLNLGLWHVR